MYPFIHLADHRLAVCQPCGFACIADEVETHLRTRHKEVGPTERDSIISQIQNLPRIIQKRSELAYFRFPPPDTAPISCLEAPQQDGLKCMLCPYIARQIQKMQAHCRNTHGWENPRKRGRQAAELPAIESAVPWRSDVQCQRFFKSREASGWFEVTGTYHPEPIPMARGPTQQLEQPRMQHQDTMRPNPNLHAAPAPIPTNLHVHHQLTPHTRPMAHTQPMTHAQPMATHTPLWTIPYGMEDMASQDDDLSVLASQDLGYLDVDSSSMWHFNNSDFQPCSSTPLPFPHDSWKIAVVDSRWEF